MSVQDWSTDPAANTSVGPVNIAEGCPAANMNNMGREIMAQVKAFVDSLPAAYQPKDGLLTALAALTTSADQLIYATGADAFAQTALTAFMRTLLDDGDAATACLTLGAVRVAGLSLGNPGYVRFQVGASSYFQVAWGNQVVSGNGATSIGYPAAFPNASWPTISGVGELSTSAQDNNPAVQSATASGFTVYNASNACTAWWIAVGY